jgi:LemA protein
MKNLVKLILGLTVILSLSSCGYNTMVQKQEAVEGKWSDVETQYQRRNDLIPNLVNTVKGYADFEQQTLTQVIEARSKATSMNINADNLTEENLQQFQQAQNQLSGALSRLMVVVERYPDLKANENFRDLQAQLEGTENRIALARKNFNEAVQDYNAYIRKFPNNMIAGIFDFEKKAYFKSTEGAETAPQVSF